MFLGKGVLEICSKFTGEHPCQSVISIKLLCKTEVTLRHGCSPVCLLYIFRIPFPKDTSGRLPLLFVIRVCQISLGYNNPSRSNVRITITSHILVKLISNITVALRLLAVQTLDLLFQGYIVFLGP